MDTLHDYISWFALMIPLIISPGPANLAVANTAQTQNLKSAMPFMIGLLSMAAVSSLAIGFFLKTIFVEYRSLFKVIEVLGIGYIFYLSYRFYQSNNKAQINNNANSKVDNDNGKKAPGLLEGVILQSLNPKSFLALTMMFGQFLKNPDNAFQEILILTGLDIGVCTISYLLWHRFGFLIKNVFINPKYNPHKNVLFSGSLALTALYMLIKI